MFRLNQLCEANNMVNRVRPEDFEFLEDLGVETGEETIQNDIRRKVNHLITELFKAGLVVLDSGGLVEFEKLMLGVFVVGRAKSQDQCSREFVPGTQLFFVVKPFEPAQSFTTHVEGDDVEPLVWWGFVETEELVGVK